MKTAMRNKDSNRLSVLRSILSQTLNASKTAAPINTDTQMLALLRKTAATSLAASEEFRAAGREDLAENETLQVKIIEDYAGSVPTVGDDEIQSAVRRVIDAIKSDRPETKIGTGDVLKKVFAPAVLGDKPVDRAKVASIVKEILAKP